MKDKDDDTETGSQRQERTTVSRFKAPSDLRLKASRLTAEVVRSPLAE